MTEPQPLRVVSVDLASAIEDVDCRRDGNDPYAGAWVLVRSAELVLGSFELPATDGSVSAAALEREIQRRFTQRPEPRHSVAEERLPSATVIVPTAMARPEQLRACIEHLRRVDYPDFEVIIVDNRHAKEPAVELSGVKVVRETRPGISAARNAGLAVATGKIVACTDDDVEVDRNWLRALAERFVNEPEAAAVTGVVVPRELETPAQIWFEESGVGLDRQYSPLSFKRHGRSEVLRTDLGDGSKQVQTLYATGEFGLGSNMAFRTEILRDHGGFDAALGAGTKTRGGEDLAILIELITAGHTIAYEPSALVFHTHRRTTDELRRQIYGYGTGFTAMLTAVTLRDRRHMIGLLRIIPAWIRSLRSPNSAKRVNRSSGYPSDLGRLELKGMVAGPFIYIRQRLAGWLDDRDEPSAGH